MSSELIDIYNAAGEKIGCVERSRAHGDNTLLHRAAHVLVFSSDGRLLLQKRSVTKRIQPGKWDASVGGHLAAGEDYLTGARRELAEELGLPEDTPLEHLFDVAIRNEIESEDARVFKAVSEGPFDFQKEEIDEVRFFTADELKDPRWRQEFTPCLIGELERIYGK
ncbi:MAG: NUDIX domain-containing protein [Lentisphaeria bacterium]|nr:NUDIX domain-containing protein [Lentisphaeria bacterium]